ncbi:MAG: tetratricopeptide repeat protein [Betaproteobacteria bacterium]
MRNAVLVVLSVFLLASGAVRAQTPDPSREQALRTLTHADAQKRRDAVDRLGEVGRMTDSAIVAQALRDADEDTREHAELALWRIWSRSGDKEVDKLFAEGMERMGAGDLQEALAKFNRIVRLKPDFAEGWNKRATLYFMVGEWAKALTDCDQVIKRNPHHFGALAGYSLIYIQLEYFERAREYARRALEVNPNMEGVKRNLMMIEEMLKEKRERTT